MAETFDSFMVAAWCGLCDQTTTQIVYCFPDGEETQECALCGTQEPYDDLIEDDEDPWYVDLAEPNDLDYEAFEALFDRPDSGGWD